MHWIILTWIGIIKRHLKFLWKSNPKQGKADWTRARVGIDRNNTKSIVEKGNRKSFLPIQSLSSFLHILIPLPNKGNFFSLREYMFHSPQSSMLATLSSLRVFQQWALASIQAPSRLCLFLPCQCTNHGFTLLAPAWMWSLGKRQMCLQWMRFMCHLTVPQVLSRPKVVHRFPGETLRPH